MSLEGSKLLPVMHTRMHFEITVELKRNRIYPFVYGKPLKGTFANSEDPDEMQHNAAFHQGLHCF